MEKREEGEGVGVGRGDWEGGGGVCREWWWRGKMGLGVRRAREVGKGMRWSWARGVGGGLRVVG